MDTHKFFSDKEYILISKRYQLYPVGEGELGFDHWRDGAKKTTM
jgi:hypothetical protein